ADDLNSSWEFASPYDNYLVTNGNITYNSGTKHLEWSISSIPPGKTEYLTFTVNNLGNNGSAWQNSAVVSSAELDPDLSDNTSSITATNLSTWANMQVTQSINPPQPIVGQNAVFTITATRIA